MIVAPSGGKWWRWKYRWNGREQLLSFGTYPEVGLKDAREKRDEARRLLASGVNPGEHRKASRAAIRDTFEVIALEWFARASLTWTPSHVAQVARILRQDVFPVLGKKPVRQITAADILDCARKVEDRGAPQVARIVVRICGQVFRYAIATRRATGNPAVEIRGALRPTTRVHMPSITEPDRIGDLLLALDRHAGSPEVGHALQLAALTFVRPQELYAAEWTEFNMDRAEWRIPAERMKMRKPHIVPLSQQALAVLRVLHQLTGDGRYLFPNWKTRSRHMGENTVNAALARLGFKGEMTGHGFRTMASTLLNESGLWSPDIIERQLAHVEQNAVRAAYNRAEHLPERRKMMQWLADQLDALRAAAAQRLATQSSTS